MIYTKEEINILKGERTSHKAVLLLIITIISSMAIYASDTTLSGPVLQSFLVFVVYFCILCVSGITFVHRSFKFSPILISPILYVTICYFANPIHRFNALLLLDLLLFVSLSDDEKIQVFLLYKKYLIFSAVCGVIAFLAFSLNLPIPYDIKPYYSENSASLYVDYRLAYLITSFPIIRLCGLFNEPGYFGTIIAFYLCADQLNLRKKDNLILFIAGLLTFSMAFYVITLLYLAFMTRHKPKILFFWIILLFVVLFILPEIDLGSSMNKLVHRFSFEDGEFVGNNRSKEPIDQTLEDMIGTSDMWFGYGQGYASDLAVETSTYKSYIIDYGFVGFFLMFGSLFLTTFFEARKNIYVLIFLICFFASVYQRPGIYNLVYFVVLLGGMKYISQSTYKLK